MPDKKVMAKASRAVRAQLSYGQKSDPITVMIVPEGMLPFDKTDKLIAGWMNYAAASKGLGRVLKRVGAVPAVTDGGIVVDVERSHIHRLARCPHVRALHVPTV